MTRPEEASVKPGDLLGGKYRVLRIIGRGGMGVVVEAKNEILGERVAVKVLHTRYVENREALARFHHEARAAVRVRGEHTVRLLDVGDTADGAPFLVMELLEGVDLSALLRKGRIPIRDAVLYVLEACVGVAEIHASGIIHRDLKPGNLFLTQRPDGSPFVKVLDFGIAKSVVPFEAGEAGSVTMTLVALGTPLYMSPEQIRSSRTVDVRTDVWSLGAILYELLGGVPAFGGNTVANITAQILESPPSAIELLRTDLPPKLDKVVQTALAKMPEQRYGDVASFAAALAPFAGDAGAAFAERAARTLKGGGAAKGSALVPRVSPSLAPEASTHIMTEFAATKQYVRPRSRNVVAALLGVFALVAVGGGLGAMRLAAQSEASSLVLSKGVAARVTVAAAIVRTAARMSGSGESGSHPAPSSESLGNQSPVLSPNELPDVPSATGLSAPPQPPRPLPAAAPKKPLPEPVDDDPLSVRR